MPRYLHPDISIDMTIDIFINNAQILSDIYIHLCCRYDYSQLVYKSLTVSWHPDIAAPPWLVARHDRRAWHCCRRSRPPFRRRFWVEVAGVSQGKSVEKWWKPIGKTWENVENLENMRNKLEKDVENMEKVWNMLGDGWDIMRYNYDFLEKKLHFLTNQPSSISCIIWAPVEIIYISVVASMVIVFLGGHVAFPVFCAIVAFGGGPTALQCCVRISHKSASTIPQWSSTILSVTHIISYHNPRFLLFRTHISWWNLKIL